MSEMMRMVRWNGEHWYEEGLIPAALKWVIWPGGWLAHRKSTYFSLRHRLHPGMWTPVSILGHRITFFGWGVQIRIHGGYLVYSTCRSRRQVYWSPDGTPDRATIWFVNAPTELVRRARSWSLMNEWEARHLHTPSRRTNR